MYNLIKIYNAQIATCEVEIVYLEKERTYNIIRYYMFFFIL